MKLDIFSEKNREDFLFDATVERSPNIFSFHQSLNRVFEKDHAFAGETHPFYELVYIIDGCVGITAGEEIYRLHSGQMLLHPPEEFHRIWSEKGTEPHLLNLSFYATEMPTARGRVFQPDSRDGVLLTEICDSIAEGLRSGDRALLNRRRLQLELWLLRVLEDGVSEQSRSSTFSAMRYAEAVNVLQQHLGEPLRTQDIAKLCNMSASALKKIFARYAGMGVSRFFTELKIHHAVVLLREGFRVSEAAEAVGFSDQNYFSTVFRRVMGSSPSSFRPTMDRNG